ncbi:putative component of NuA3 histone acetyltransferase complex [Coniosporium apollinis]|uniref:Component of NuA3 histone acetyltransferase complex n=1 Tax=Coniosporium apollinis TaxID=61459 RepID=A0ABQ9P3J8_9PEZI|nr:putative component of NuA3 histone acetyltransferase complex [Coniosporium apollinis]
MKRKNEDSEPANGQSKKRAVSPTSTHSNFRKGLFDSKTLGEYTKQYAVSQPYKHAIIPSLINDTLLRSVRSEILENLHFTPKETDIYKIHQSGDLANLSGLDSSSLSRLPSLLTLRDALYSPEFRQYVSTVADSGPLSGQKTDMAINVYTPGCHLLCHDDVIGSRRVSYILYLLDPDVPWKPEYGGALRLYPTEERTTKKGEVVKVPRPDWSVVIPPQWNQLAFFTVQPGESFHDVEEVYRRGEGESEEDGGRVRMAISGWYHIPQEGEEGYDPELEARLAEKSSLSQLQGKTDEFDLPQPQWRAFPEESAEDAEEPELSEQDLEFLVKYITPSYLTPDIVEELSSSFQEESSLRLSNLLNKKFAARLRTFIEAAEKHPVIPAPAAAANNCGVAAPPHKHRFLFRQPRTEPPSAQEETSPYDELLDILFPSLAFKKWLALATGLTLSKANILARRFRRGMDYTLATSYEEEEPQLEICLGITPSKGWGDEEEEEGEGEDTQDTAAKGAAKGKNGEGSSKSKATADTADDEDTVGGYEVYMAGDDADDADDGSDDGVEIPASLAKKNQSSSTGAGQRRSAGNRKADPAIYKSSTTDEDDGVLFSMPAGWNNMSIVLRDTGVLRFVKYVSRSARGDRWDVCGEFGVVGLEEDREGGEE